MDDAVAAISRRMSLVRLAGRTGRAWERSVGRRARDDGSYSRYWSSWRITMQSSSV